MRKKKKTIEELVEEALVPGREQPYNLSDKWQWVKLGSVITLISGRDLSTKLCNNEGLGTPYIMGASNIINNELAIERWVENPTVIGIKDDILISVKGTVGKIIIQDIEKLHLSRQIMAIRCSHNVYNKYLYFYLLTYIEKLKEVSKGIIPGISRDDILNAPFPFPSLNEQKRIAEKVERFLNKINESRQLIEEAKETFELRREALLDMAFRGDLTRKWRESNPDIDTLGVQKHIEMLRNDKESSSIKSNTLQIKSVLKDDEPFELPRGWKWVKLGELSFYITSGSRDWSKYYADKGSYFIRTQDINKNNLNLEKVAHVLLPEKVEGKRSLVEPFDLLTTITGANVGKCALVEEAIPESYVSQSVALTKLIDKSMAKYIHLSLLSPRGGGGELESRAYGIGRPVLSLEDIKNIKLPIAPYKERQVIINLLVKLLDMEETTGKLLLLEEKLNQIKDSILSKAFRGELGTNDPSDKMASELLEDFFQEQVN